MVDSVKNKIVSEFKEHKKVMLIKMEQATKMADDAADEFIDFVKSLVASASREDVQALLKMADEDDTIDEVDKAAILAMYIETHDDVDGVTVIKYKK